MDNQASREEEAARARRLIRFGGEVEPRPQPKSPNIANENEGPMSKSPARAALGPPPEASSRGVNAKWKESYSPVGRNETVVDTDMPDNSITEAILGSCPDMCPEVEREERERKGDLDKFERLGGIRNQTARNLAVKKYTRTAEKDAVLIRPLAVLKDTMAHLLSLLDRGHEDDLLAVHSFLWDRMRAVRMDLRMQHIFTQEAITMHEQMIRFHILAMHELCEFSKGEGISDLFNAHLNIEQMNKTSVDLFQMYDDHSKRGLSIPTEAEFRGYYALLKLDKHPGYRVEPAELSLDLAKMTPEMRNSPQVRFARDVARACRASNYVAFFRLAREATYLQACLMHAHFSKLRTQALAALYSGLQKNQGIPLSTVINWLGMEGEDIEALIQYHGFSIKYYEEPFMVKEGPFLNKNKDFPTSRSQLVEARRSLRIILDVQSERHVDLVPKNLGKVKRVEGPVRIGALEKTAALGSDAPQDIPALGPLDATVITKEEDMPDYVEEPVEPEAEEVEPVKFAPVVESMRLVAEELAKQAKRRRREELQFEAEEHEKRRLRHEAAAAAAARQAASQAAIERKKVEQKLRDQRHQAEASRGKQGSWFRKWRRRAAAKALKRWQKLQQREAALDTLILGYPLWKMRVIGESVSSDQRHEFINSLVEEQGFTLQRMWEPLNMPKLVGPVLQELYPAASFLSWNLLLRIPSSWSGKWVRTKVSSRQKSSTIQDFADQILSSIKLAEESIPFSEMQHCTIVDFWYSTCEVGSAGGSMLQSTMAVSGASGLLFVINEDESILEERGRLHKLVKALPGSMSVPLLILSAKASSKQPSQVQQFKDEEDLEQLLRLGDLNISKISSHKIISITDYSGSNFGRKGLFTDEALKEGLVWLAKLCPAQPHLRSLYVGDLLKEHIDTHLKLLQETPPPEVTAEHRIFVFNKRLQNSPEEVDSTGSCFPTNWSPLGSIRVQKKFKDEGQEPAPASEVFNSEERVTAPFVVLPVTGGHSVGHRKQEGVYKSSPLSPVSLQGTSRFKEGYSEDNWIDFSEERVGHKSSVMSPVSLKRTHQVSEQSFQLAPTPFEVLLDQMTAEISRNTCTRSEEYLVEMAMTNKDTIEEYRAKYLELQCSSLTT